MSRGDARVLSSPDPRSRYHPLRWLLLTGSRRKIAVVLSALVLATLLVVGSLWEIEMATLVNETRAVQSLFNTLLGGIILFVSVVLSINTAALTQEFDPLRTKHVQIEESIELQAELERFVGSGTSPADVDGFFLFVLRALRTEADRLEELIETSGDEPARRAVTSFLDDLEGRTAVVERRIDPGNRRLSETLLAALDWHPVDHVYVARRIRSEHGDALGEPELNSISNVIEILTTFASGREYFTTLYFKREIRDLSSNLLVLSLPVIVFTAYVLLAIDADLFPPFTAFGIQPRLLYVSVAFVVALSPYVLLSAYVLRIVTVSKHTLGSGGFTITAADDRRIA